MRLGFVSNSSSTAFILDLRDEGVKELVESNNNVPKPLGLDRRTALAVGPFAVHYGRQWVADNAYWDSEYRGLGHWIVEHALELGTENIVFARESDEGMGGWLVNSRKFRELAVAEMEYH
jgi:hypothetical protein